MSDERPGRLVIVSESLRRLEVAKPGEPAPARVVYGGRPFAARAEYAQRFGERWLILSLALGLLDPDAPIEPHYGTAGSVREIGRRLPEQLREYDAHRYAIVEVLGGENYCRAVANALAQIGGPTVSAPIRGLRMGEMYLAIRKRVLAGVPFPVVALPPAPSVRRQPSASSTS